MTNAPCDRRGAPVCLGALAEAAFPCHNPRRFVGATAADLFTPVYSGQLVDELTSGPSDPAAQHAPMVAFRTIVALDLLSTMLRLTGFSMPIREALRTTTWWHSRTEASKRWPILKGGRSLIPGSGRHMVLASILHANGLDLGASSVKGVPLAGTEVARSFASRSVDAAIVVGGQYFRIGKLPIIADGR